MTMRASPSTWALSQEPPQAPAAESRPNSVPSRHRTCPCRAREGRAASAVTRTITRDPEAAWCGLCPRT